MSTASVALVCDFFFPALGGVEVHIKELAKYMTRHLQNLIVITHQYHNYVGLHQIQGVKVYYLALPFSSSLNIIYPSFIFEFRQAKQILEHQKINVLHCHQTGSTLSLEYAVFGKILGLKVIHTEHSLYGYTKLSDIHFNRLLNIIFPHYDRVICVSRTTRNNFLLRSGIDPQKVVVVPNSVIIKFNLSYQNEHQEQNQKIKIIVVGRLVYRRGTDLLIQVLPDLCRRNPNIQVEIVGDGPKMIPLRAQIKRFNLQKQVNLHGALKNAQTIKIMKKCQIFLNTAITQSFGIALVEAASVGLHCVSTNVGGISQTLPPNVLHLVEINKVQIIEQIQRVIQIVSLQNCQKKQKIQFYEHQDCCQRILEIYQVVNVQQKETQKQFFMKICNKIETPTLIFILIFLILNSLNFIIELIYQVKRIILRKQRIVRPSQKLKIQEQPDAQ